MPEILRMPEVAAGAESGTIGEWLVSDGDEFAAAGALATIETDKAVVDLSAEADGVVLRLLAGPGAEVKVGEPIALIARPGEAVDDADAALAGLLGGTRPGPDPVPDAPKSPRGDAGPHRVEGQGRRVFASPIARRLAARHGIGTDEIVGTGPHGRIVRADVEAAVAARPGVPGEATPPGPTAAPGEATPPGPVAPLAPVEEASPQGRLAEGATAQPSVPEAKATGATIPHSRMRRAVAARLGESKRTVPHFYLRGAARVDALLALRAQLNEVAPVKVSVNDLIVKAVACAHTAVPEANVAWTDEAMVTPATVDVGVAVATDGGLVTPVVRDVGRSSVTAVATATADLGERARRGQLRQAELEGGTVTVTNLGMYGTAEFAAIINPPQSMILAVGAARTEPVVMDGALAVATVLHLTVSVDHRAVDGALAARWMAELVAVLEAPLRLVA